MTEHESEILSDEAVISLYLQESPLEEEKKREVYTRLYSAMVCVDTTMQPDEFVVLVDSSEQLGAAEKDIKEYIRLSTAIPSRAFSERRYRSRLTVKEASTLIEYYGLRTGVSVSERTIASAKEVSREAISRQRRQALNKLRGQESIRQHIQITPLQRSKNWS